MNEKCTRKSTPPVKVYCLPDKRAQVQVNVRAVGKPLSTYLLKVGLGYHVPHLTNHRRANEPLRINADLRRLGRSLTTTSFSG
jgi:hypothetical protein